jgi:ABC-type phosphate transport system substrate-binding protein
MSKLRVALLALILLTRVVSAETREIAIIVNVRLPVDSISLEEVKGIYLGEIRFIQERPLKPIDQHESQEIREVFLRDVLEMSKTAYLRHWIHLVFVDSIDAPILRENSAAVIETVRASEEVIGYVWTSETIDQKGVKIVLTLPEGEDGGALKREKDATSRKRLLHRS